MGVLKGFLRDCYGNFTGKYIPTTNKQINEHCKQFRNKKTCRNRWTKTASSTHIYIYIYIYIYRTLKNTRNKLDKELRVQEERTQDIENNRKEHEIQQPQRTTARKTHTQIQKMENAQKTSNTHRNKSKHKTSKKHDR